MSSLRVDQDKRGELPYKRSGRVMQAKTLKDLVDLISPRLASRSR